MNLYLKQIQDQGHREETGGCKQEEIGGGMDWDTGFRTLEQLYIEWINKKFPLHGTGNCISIL